MTHRTLLAAVAGLALGASCLDSATTPDGDGAGQIHITVAPLALDGVVDASYRITVTNAAGGGGETVWQRVVTSGQYGDGAGSLSYVGPCDASAGTNTVTLELLSLVDAGGEIPTGTYQNPGALSREVVCVADGDVSVSFDITIARDATQGFFDVAIEFDDIFCSAKLDCVDDSTGGDLELLHNNATGARDLTAVMGFACTAATAGPTWLYIDDPVITCDNLGNITVDASASGNVDLTQAPNANPGGYLFGAAVYRGDEALASKSYWNISLGLDATKFAGAGACVLTGRATAATDAWPQTALGFPLPEGRVYPVVEWNVTLSEAVQGRVCTTHAVNDGSGVSVAYHGHVPAANQFTWSPQLLYLDHRYERGGSVLSATPHSYPTDGLILHVDAAVDPSGTSLDPTGDVPDVMTATYVDSGPKYWTSDPETSPGYMLWAKDDRWRASGSYTLAGWFYQVDGSHRMALWSQYVDGGAAPKKFNWMMDPGGAYHNNQVAGGGKNYAGSFYETGTWHFHVMTFEDGGQLRISVDGSPWAVVVDDINASQANAYADVALLARNDNLATERFDGRVSMAWYYDRVLSDAELIQMYEATKGRHGVDRVFNPGLVGPPPTPTTYPTAGLMIHVDAAVNTSATSLDPTGDVPDTMTAVHRELGPRYWEGGPGRIIRWSADSRWSAPSYTLCGWFRKDADGRHILWSQFPNASKKFNWASDTGGQYHNNMAASGGWDYHSGSWYDNGTWHFHAMTYDATSGDFRISVDGQPNAVVAATYSSVPAMSEFHDVSLIARSDSGIEALVGGVAQAWYYDRALSDAELATIYATSKARYGVDRPYGHAAP